MMKDSPDPIGITTDRPISDKLEALHRIFDRMDGVLIAYSGGVDSAYLLKVAVERLGEKVLAVTADSPTIPRSELESAINLAAEIGARHEVVTTGEMNDADFVTNPPDRCYHCKKTLFDRLTRLARERGIDTLVEGSNFSDLSDYRPGSKAVGEFRIQSPLREVGLTKDEIRALSCEAGLPTWDKPAAPCLSSRIPYGSVITEVKLSRIEEAEKYLRSLGLREFRVRDHEDIARLEIEPESMTTMIEPGRAAEVVARLKELGYRYVALDLLGFRSGSLNEILIEDNDG